MIGPKKLTTIRRELHQALATTGDDPIRWLEERMSLPAGQGAAASESSEVLDSLRQFLSGDGRGKTRKPRIATRK